MDAEAGSFDPGPSVVFTTYEHGASFSVVKHREDRWGLEIARNSEQYRLTGSSFKEVWDWMIQHIRAWRPRVVQKQDWSPRDGGN